MDIFSETGSEMSGPAAAAVARHRGGGGHGVSPTGNPFSAPDVRANALRGFHALMTVLNLQVLAQYNAAWTYLLQTAEGVILARAAQVPHKREDPGTVWRRLVENHQKLGAIMLTMEDQYRVIYPTLLDPDRSETYIEMVVKYFHLKSTFRQSVDKAAALTLKKIKMTMRAHQKGFDPARAAIWGERVAMQAKYRKAIYAEATRMRKIAKHWMSAAAQLEETIPRFDPALASVQEELAPPASKIREWTDEFAQMSREKQETEWRGEIEFFLSEKSKEYTEEEVKTFFTDDRRWSDFLQVNANALRKKLAAKEARLSKFMAEGISEQIKRIFPDFDEEAVDEGASASEGGDPDD